MINKVVAQQNFNNMVLASQILYIKMFQEIYMKKQIY